MKRRPKGAPRPGGKYVVLPSIDLYSDDFLAGEWMPPQIVMKEDGEYVREDPTEDWIEVRADGWFRKRPEKDANDLRPKTIRLG